MDVEEKMSEVDYSACGVPVTLIGVRQPLEGFTTIPLTYALHSLIAQTLLQNRETLNAAEIRYLRSEAELREEEVPPELMQFDAMGGFVSSIVDERFRVFIIEKLRLPFRRTDILQILRRGNTMYGRKRNYPLRIAYDVREVYVLLNP